MSRFDLITVCDKCLMASCWQCIFMCQESQNAGTIQKTRLELARLNREHSDYMKTDEQLSAEANEQNVSEKGGVKDGANRSKVSIRF